MNNLKQTGLAVHSYHDVYRRCPPGTIALSLPPQERLSWMVLILPFVEQDPLFARIDREQGWQAAVNQAAGAIVVPPYSCPYQPEAAKQGQAAVSPFVGMAGVGPDAATLPLEDRRAGFFGYDRRVAFKDVSDGASSTILAIETRAENGPWIAGGHGTVRGYDPHNVPSVGVNRPFGIKHRDDNFFRTHPLFAHAVMGDGSSRSLSSTTTPATFRALATIAGRDEVGRE